ncbi:gamma-tubulin complex component, putative [Ixodes scapularis]|uniref:Gamma-tubulin complex component n=1 Tax=Ixodes scapularis TaxID=6945 RepID=B7Q2E7_IXOSC|nr:gamma-tubulin complex component, putative [Ixodes scapularis]|eukprot:XP_002410743.1 gamma-tubulin complex component, putative [Ixodes scapularis]
MSGKPWDVPVEDRVVAKAIEMQLKSRHQDALRLRACLSKLRGTSGRCSDGVQACLEFLLCLSETRPAKPSEGRRLFELPSIMEPSYQLCAAQPGFDLNGNPLFGSFGRRRAVGGTSENGRSSAGSLPRIAPLNALTRNTVVSRRFNEARSTKPDVFSGARLKEEEVHVGQKTVQQSSKTDEDIWESVLRSKSRQHFTWETLGCVGVTKEEPFLTEAGQEAAEATQQFCLQLSSIVLGSETDSAVVDQTLLVQHIVQLLAGIPSDYFPYDAFVGRFVVKKGIRLSGMSSEALAPMMSEFASCGAKVRFLDTISSPPSEPGDAQRCLTLAAFREGLKRYLHHYRGALLPMTEHLDSLTVMQLHHLTNGLREQIEFLANFCVMEVQMSGSGQEGMRLLGRLQRKAEEVRGLQGYIVMVFLLQHACRPYLGFLQDWLFNGICNDQYGEFPIQLNEESAALRDAEFWESSFALRFGGDSAEEVPFLDDCLDDVFKCAKATMLLKVCRPQTPLFRKGTDRPTLRLAFTVSKLAEIEAASQRYLEDTGRELELGVLPRLRPGHFPDVEVQEPFPSNLFPLADHEPDEESLADWSQDSGFDRLPLEVVLKRSLLPPLTAQIRLVDRACVTFLIKDLGLYAHLEALSNFFCFQDGEFGQGFCDAVCEKIDWPLNIVITSPCLLRYNKIFGFLLYIRRTQWALFDIWCNLKPSALPRNPHGSPQFQQLQLMRHEMQQFVQLLQGYVGGQVMQTSLAELQDDLDRQVRNVDDLRNTHLLFLKRLSQRLLLARRATPVAKLLREALRTVLLFQAELSAQSWLVEGGELRHPAFRRFQHAHTKFRQTVNLLLTSDADELGGVAVSAELLQALIGSGLHRVPVA